MLSRVVTFCRHPRSNAVRLARPWIRPALQRIHRYRLAQHVDLEFLSQRPATTFAPDFSDFWFLYRTVRRNKPRVVLEFGSGGSTVVLAKALYDNGREAPGTAGYLYSIDDQRNWAEVTRSTLPPFLHAFCEVRHIPTVEVEHDGVPGFRHATLPDMVPDMVYLDGPTFTKGRNVAIDLLDMEQAFPPHFVLIIDGRDANTKFLKKYLTRRFHFRHRVWSENTVVTLLR